MLFSLLFSFAAESSSHKLNLIQITELLTKLTVSQIDAGVGDPESCFLSLS